jgi:uncharacterized protein
MSARLTQHWRHLPNRRAAGDGEPRLRADIHPVVVFIVLVFGMSAVFYLFGAIFGGLDAMTGAPLPASALMFVCPALAAALLVRREDGGIRRWLRCGLRLPQGRRCWWWVPALGLMPLILVVGYVLTERVGVALQAPTLPWSTLPMLVAVFTLSAVGEELGWTAFATERLRERYGVLVIGLVLGSAWALWHVVPFAQTGHDWVWIVWQCLFTVAFRLILVQLYVAAGRSLAVPVLAHAGYNVAWAMSPVGGSSYNPAVAAVITAVAAGVFAWSGVGRTSPRAGSQPRHSSRVQGG